MFEVKIHGLESLRSTLKDQKQIRFASSVALNRVAKEIERKDRERMTGVFDRPKSQTVRATYMIASTKNDLRAVVGIKDRSRGIPAAEYLHPNIGKAGKQPRNYKRSEFMLNRMGILPDGMFTVPGKGARLDSFGNMSRGQIVQILSYLQAFGKTALNTKRMNMTAEGRAKAQKQRRQYFVVPVADRNLKLFPGIWQEAAGRQIVPVLMFVKRPQYRAIYDFEGIAADVVRRTFGSEFDAALENALRTAR